MPWIVIYTDFLADNTCFGHLDSGGSVPIPSYSEKTQGKNPFILIHKASLYSMEGCSPDHTAGAPHKTWGVLPHITEGYTVPGHIEGCF